MAGGPFDLGGLTVTELAKRVWTEITYDELWDAAAQLGYYFLLALFPLVVVLLSFVALVPGLDLVEPFMHTLRNVMPGQAFDLIAREIARIQESSSSGLITFGMLGTIWAASSGVVSLMGTLNRAYEAKESRGFVRLRVTAVGLTFAFAFLLLTGSMLLTMGDRIAGAVAGWLGFEWIAKVVGTGINYALGVAILFIALEVVYYFGPNVRKRWRWVSPGSIVGVGLFVLSSVGFSLYVRLNDTYSVTYGSIGAVIVLMLWLYLLGLSIVLGAEVNSEIAIAVEKRAESDASASKPEPEPRTEPADAPHRRSRTPIVDAATLAPYFSLTSRTAPAGRLVVRDLLRALVHENARVRAGAAATIGHLRPDDAAVSALLVTRLTDEDLEVRSAAIRALERIGAPAVSALEQAAHDEDPERRRVAAQTLARVVGAA